VGCPIVFSRLKASLTMARSVSCDSRELEDRPLAQPRSFGLAFLAAVICGSINNLTYCVISGASQSLVRHFRMQSQVAVLTMSMTGFSLMTAVVSTRFLIQLRFYTRVLLVLFMCTATYAGMAVASTMEGAAGFVVAVLFSCVAGGQQVIGEVTNLAFLKAFPPELIGAWGAGTGISGILGGGIYVLLSGLLGLSNMVIFGLMLPTALPYWAAFHYLHREATRGKEGANLAKVVGGTSSLTRVGGDFGPREQLQPSEVMVAPATLANIQTAFRCSGFIMFNLVAVYVLEYAVFPGLADRETLCSSKEWYATMWMCYNIGVMMSRLSVAIFRIERVWLITILQLTNVVGWFAEVYSGRIRDALPEEHGLYIMAAWMIIVGLCGGATYGNCMYLFNNKEGIPENIRELGVNLAMMMSNVGIATITLSFSLLDNTVLAKSVVYPHGC